MKLTRYASGSFLRTNGVGNSQVVEGSNAQVELRRLYRLLRKNGASLYEAHSTVYDVVFAMGLSTTSVTFVAADGGAEYPTHVVVGAR